MEAPGANAAAAAAPGTEAVTGCTSANERYRASLRRYSPVQKGLAGLPRPGEWLCGRCGPTYRPFVESLQARPLA